MGSITRQWALQRARESLERAERERLEIAEHEAAPYLRAQRWTFWYGWIWGVAAGIAFSLVVYFGVEAWRIWATL
jgi:hypothetical protein